MSTIEDLIQRARHLRSEGHSPGQIADELSLSMETVTWLLTQEKGASTPKDVHIDWTAVSGDAVLLEQSAMMLLSRYHKMQQDATSPTAIVGISISGIPLATFMSAAETSRLAIYHPSKHSTVENPVGSMSGNFEINPGDRCVVVDDVITSGDTLHEVVAYLKNHGCTPLACCVIFDKRGIREIEGVPVYSLFRISRID
ncbi:MAG: orotate phosphoribosyltransferase-like protein [Methanospirillum sp.]|uniref:orotate phosphoribosyltransferase-like protein n=1 Tax=Methanospirillum sp. TaxID=45200 RepID=UPI00236BA512|nr:orotate phosphoribosyltransferase-like protein [Methanospirillum sp.]MDD1729916.1 orotate phosphoribosyltransferase-like protein [Methanospirillum sp.]